MNCPNCTTGKLKVKKTVKLTKERVRIRECDDCGHRVETVQPLETISSAMVPAS